MISTHVPYLVNALTAQHHVYCRQYFGKAHSELICWNRLWYFKDLGLTCQFELGIQAKYLAVSFHRQLYRHPFANNRSLDLWIRQQWSYEFGKRSISDEVGFLSLIRHLSVFWGHVLSHKEISVYDSIYSITVRYTSSLCYSRHILHYSNTWHKTCWLL